MIKDLIEVEDFDSHFDQLKIYYEQAQIEIIVQAAKKLNEAFERYETATCKITLNKDNLEDYLFTYVHYQS